jgi:hypothetical protein
MAAGEFIASVPSAVTVNSVAILGVVGASISVQAENSIMHTDDKKYPFDGGNINAAPPTVTLDVVSYRGESPGTLLEVLFAEGDKPTGSLVITRAGRGTASGNHTATIANHRVVSRSESERNGRRQISITIQAFGTDGAASGVVYAFS